MVTTMSLFHPNECQIWRTIPLKFLPNTDIQYTTKWAQETYCYRYLFDDNTTSESYKSEEEVEDWRLQALQLMREIKHIGIAHGRNEIVKLARSHYGMVMPQSGNYKPTNIDDVMSIIGDEDWYNDNKEFKLNIIYHLMYGLTRSGMNGWLIDQERKWLQDHKLQYTQDHVGVRKTKLRGFVYSIMNCQFSNSTIKLFHNIMKRNYGEFITVRKPTKTLPSHITYINRTFLGGSGYIVKCEDIINHNVQLKGNKVEQMCNRWIKMCQREDLSLLDMHDMLDETYTSVESVDHVTQTKTIIKALNRADVQKFVTPDKSTRKQPRVNVMPRQLRQDTDSTGKL